MVAEKLGGLQGELGKGIADVGLQGGGHPIERREQLGEEALPGGNQRVVGFGHIQSDPAFIGIHHQQHTVHHLHDPLHLTTARILTRHTATYWSTALIDRGLADNLAPDLPVRTAEGLVGKIVHLYDRESEVLFITDETCKVAVRIEGTTEQGILTGVRGITSRSPELRITYLPSEAIVPVGAKVFTSGKGTVFPPDILVGEVIRFNKLDDGGEAVVRPAVDFDKIKYVFVIDRSPAASAPAAATTPPRPEVAPQ